MKSPFKFLDAYTSADKAVFFGREEEVKNLYQLVYKSSLILVYGASGTGKTSLLQCGLGSRFDLTDWYPFEIRRNHDINDSLRQQLAAPAGGSLRKDSLTATIAWIYKNYLRPLYLIFDQLEELFILGDEAEQRLFIQHIHEITQAELPCKIILVMREEYIAQLYQFEQVIPSLFDRRLRVEPMNAANVARVITGSCDQFQIELQEGEQNVAQIIDYVSGGKSGIQLPYLQVYLDRLWLEERSEGRGQKSEGVSPVVFTRAGIDALGEMEDVLEKFLQQRREVIQRELQQAFEEVPPDALGQILDVFVTEEGTKQPVVYRRVEGQVVLAPHLHSRLAALPAAAVQAGLEALEQARILRFSDKQIELAHDSLAELIERERSSEQRQLNQIKRRISAAYVEYKESGVYLEERQLNSLEEFLPRLRLTPHLTDFLEDCRADITRKKQEEQERQARELKLTQDKLAAEQKARKRQRIFTVLIGIALLIAVGLVFVTLQQQRTIQAEKDKTEQALVNFKAEQAKKDSLEALNLVIKVDRILRGAATLEEKSADYAPLIRSLRAEADSLLNQDTSNVYLDEKRIEVRALLN